MSLDEIREEFFPPEDDRPHLGPGIYPNMSHEDYHADPCAVPSLSASVAKILCEESPEDAHLVHAQLGGHRRAATRDMDRGTIIHLLVLGRGQMFQEIEADNYTTRSARSQRDGAAAEGLVPVLSRDLEEFQRLARLFREKLERHEDHQGKPDPIVLDGQSEVSGIWEDEDVLCRLRSDHWKPHDWDIFDVKTTLLSIAPDKIMRWMYSNGCDVQHAAYKRGMGKLADAVSRVRMRFLFLQVRPPYGVLVVEPTGDFAELGERRWRRARDTWRVCLADHLSEDPARRARAWPGHGANRTVRISAAPWMLAAEADTAAQAMVIAPPEF